MVLVGTAGAAPMTNVNLKAPLNYGAVGYVQVKLTDTIRATASYSWGQQNTLSELPTDRAYDLRHI